MSAFFHFFFLGVGGVVLEASYEIEPSSWLVVTSWGKGYQKIILHKCACMST